MGLAGAAAFIVAFTPEITSFLREFGERIKSATNKDKSGKSFLDGIADFFLDPFSGKSSTQTLIDRATGLPVGKGGAGLTRPGTGLGGLPRQTRPDEGLAPIDESTTRRTRRRKGKASKTRNGIRVETDPGVQTTVSMDNLGTLNVRRLIVARAEGLSGVAGGTGRAGTGSGSGGGVTATTGRVTSGAEKAAQDYYDRLRRQHTRQTARAVSSMSSVGVLGGVEKFTDVNVDTTAIRNFMRGKPATGAKAHINVEKIEVKAPKGHNPDARATAVLLGRELERRGSR